ncbi:MAG: hypothetical protein KKE61_23925 [Proteobacteria bacterium]|nr:hypothetical protein [Pseudomonadota bacterium]
MDQLKTIPADEFFLKDPEKLIAFPSRRIQSCICILLGMATGLIAWNIYLPVAVLLPVIWSKTTIKKSAWLVGLGYHLVASRGLISGIPVFFDATVFYGVFLWLAAGSIQSLPYYLCAYIKNPYIAIMLLFTVLILPPVGIVGWANPLTAAGVLFPGTGFAGLFLTILLICSMVWLYGKNKAALGIVMVLMFSLPLVNSSPGESESNLPNIKGISTDFAGNPVHLGDKFNKDHQKFIKIYNEYGRSDFKTLVLPETSAGIWFDSTKQLWGRWQRGLKKDQSVILSTLLPENDRSLKTYNALVEMKKDGFAVLYKARQSVPVAMWRPWDKDSVKSNWFDNPVFEIAGKKATALVCYEAYLTWPVLQSFLSGDPEIILFVANHWWSKDTSLLRIQRDCVSAWAGLFGVPVVTAIDQ